MKRPITLPLFALLLTSACADHSALDSVASNRAVTGAYPTLVPLEGLLTDANSGTLTEATAAELDARIAALKRRAAKLRRVEL